MSSKRTQVLQQIYALSRKWFWGHDEVMQLDEYLRALAHLDGYYSPSTVEARRWYDERKYGLEEIGRLESPEAVSLLVSIAKKHGGVAIYELVVDVLDNMRHPAAVEGLRKLARSGESFEREVAARALKEKT